MSCLVKSPISPKHSISRHHIRYLWRIHPSCSYRLLSGCLLCCPRPHFVPLSLSLPSLGYIYAYFGVHSWVNRLTGLVSVIISSDQLLRHSLLLFFNLFSNEPIFFGEEDEEESEETRRRLITHVAKRANSTRPRIALSPFKQLFCCRSRQDYREHHRSHSEFST